MGDIAVNPAPRQAVPPIDSEGPNSPPAPTSISETSTESTQAEASPSWSEVFNDNADEVAYLSINAATFGLGGWALDKLGLTNRVDKESTTYKTGKAVDTAVGIATLRPKALLKGAWKGLGKVGGSLRDIAVSTKKVINKVGDLKVDDLAQGVKRLTRAGSNFRDYRKTFFAANPELAGKVVVHHAVEQQVLKKYPGLFTEAELHSLGNLRGIPKELNNGLHLREIRREWDLFYRAHPRATKQQILDQAEKIDKMFGEQFNPPFI